MLRVVLPSHSWDCLWLEQSWVADQLSSTHSSFNIRGWCCIRTWHLYVHLSLPLTEPLHSHRFRKDQAVVLIHAWIPPQDCHDQHTCQKKYTLLWREPPVNEGIQVQVGIDVYTTFLAKGVKKFVHVREVKDIKNWFFCQTLRWCWTRFLEGTLHQCYLKPQGPFFHQDL